MKGLDDIARAAGLDPDGTEYRLSRELAKSDGDLLEVLVETRKAKGLTQQAVAERMRRDKAAVSNFERLGTDPHLSTIRRYAAAIGVMIRHDVTDFETQISYSESTPLQNIGRHGFERASFDTASSATETLLSWADAEPINLGDFRRRKASEVALNPRQADTSCYG